MAQLKVNFMRRNVFKTLTRLYCTEKPATILETPKATKRTDHVQDSSNLVSENSEECAKFEERVVKQVLIEKEQDAHLQSRLSKDCKVFFARSNNATALRCGSIRVDQLTPRIDSPDWLSYDFNKLQTDNTNKCPPNSAEAPQPGAPAKPEDAHSAPAGSQSDGAGGGGSPASTALRIVRGEPGKVLFAFVPEEWWRAFIPKTGVSGFGVFVFTFSTFLVSKEYYVLEHEYYGGLSMLLLFYLGIKYFGAQVGHMLDKDIDEYQKSWETERETTKKMLDDNILAELHLQYQMAGQELLIAAKRENVLLQLEEEYRKRQMEVYEEVKKRLDYQVAVELVHQKVQHRNLIEYVTKEVLKAITPEMQDKLVNYSIDQIMHDIEKLKKPK